MFVSGLGYWDVGLVTPTLDLSFWKLGLRPSFILKKKLLLFLDLDPGALDLLHQRWTCHFEAGPAAQLHSWWEIIIVSGIECWDIGLVTPASDLSFWSWAFGQASFLMTNGDCFWTWMLGDGTCHFSIKLVILELDLRRSFILNKKLYCFWTWNWGVGLVTPGSYLNTSKIVG